jgi:hypothetical protein
VDESTVEETSAGTGLISESEFLDLVSDFPMFEGADDGSLIELGRSTCDVMKAGGDDGWIYNVKNLTDNGIDAQDAGELIAYSVAAFCPEEMSKLP